MILTEELFKKGLKSGKYISKAQCLLFGIPVENNRKQKKILIGKEITEETYNRFLELKLKQKRKSVLEKVKTLKKIVLKTDTKTVDIETLKTYAKDNTILEEAINKMPYSVFLKTQYWRSITKYLRDKAGHKCQICGKENNLQVHRKTYLHHGKEVFYLDDLIVLCDKCHHNEHIKNPNLSVRLCPFSSRPKGIRYRVTNQ